MATSKTESLGNTYAFPQDIENLAEQSDYKFLTKDKYYQDQLAFNMDKVKVMVHKELDQRDRDNRTKANLITAIIAIICSIFVPLFIKLAFG